MAYVWWGLASFVVLFLAVSFLRFQLLLHFLRMPGHTEAYVRLFFFRGLLSYTFYIPLMNRPSSETARPEAYKEDLGEEAERFFVQVKEKLERLEDLRYAARLFLAKIEVRTFVWRTALGMKDAAWTGAAAGALWALKGGVVSAANRLTNVTAKPEIEVTPVFGQPVWKMECSCMISLRTGHAIAAVIPLFFRRRSRKKRAPAGLFF